MGLRRWLLRLLSKPDPDDPARLTLRVDTALVGSLERLARREGRAAEALAGEVLARKLAIRLTLQERERQWRTLTPREQQVAALVCQRLTTRQIAARLRAKAATVKVHRRRILRKMGVQSQEALRKALAEWGFEDEEGAGF
jgi:DNA-binding CsgD family transcriptional regulator